MKTKNLTPDDLVYYQACNRLSLDDLSEQFGVSTSTVKKWLKGVKDIPKSIEIIIALRKDNTFLRRIKEKLEDSKAVLL